MQAHRIIFTETRHASSVAVSHSDDLPAALQALGLRETRPVLVLIGGAAGLGAEHTIKIQQALSVAVETAVEMDAAIIDGGTDSGVMAFIGEVYALRQCRFPLIGMAVESLVTWPGCPAHEKRTPLESHHSHFILVPGRHWGDESTWIAQAATLLAGDHPSLVLLVNGGEISRRDLTHNLEAGRPALILQGSGRLADELAGKLFDPLMHAIPLDNAAALAEAIRKNLSRR